MRDDTIERLLIAQLPPGMQSAHYFDRAQIVPCPAGGYVRDKDGAFGLPLYVSPTLLFAAGGLATSLDDVIAWDAALRERTLLPPNLHERSGLQCAWRVAARRAMASAGGSATTVVGASSTMPAAFPAPPPSTGASSKTISR